MTTMRNLINQLVAKTQFWWAKRTIVEGKDFIWNKDKASNAAFGESPTIEITTGKYAGVKFRFIDIAISDEENALLSFKTQVEYVPGGALESAYNVFDPSFAKLTSNILRIVLTNAARENQSAAKLDQEITNENRTTDTEESHEEREFHEESTPLLEKRISERKSRKKAVSRNARLHPEVQPTSKPKRNRSNVTRKNKPNRK